MDSSCSPVQRFIVTVHNTGSQFTNQQDSAAKQSRRFQQTVSSKEVWMCGWFCKQAVMAVCWLNPLPPYSPRRSKKKKKHAQKLVVGNGSFNPWRITLKVCWVAQSTKPVFKCFYWRCPAKGPALPISAFPGSRWSACSPLHTGNAMAKGYTLAHYNLWGQRHPFFCPMALNYLCLYKQLFDPD